MNPTSVPGGAPAVEVRAPEEARAPSSPHRPAWPTWRSGGWVLLVGLLLREALSFWTGHPYDLEVWIRTGYVVAHGINPYLHPWPAVPGVSFGYVDEPLPSAAYLPFWPLVFGGSYRLWEAVGGGNRFVLYFLLKQGPIAGDIATAALLYRYVLGATGDPKRAAAILAFWSFFPYDLLIGAVWGQLDPVTTAIVLVVLLVGERKAASRNLLWGLGIFVKWITAIYLPLELFLHRGLRRLWPFAGALLAFGLTILAFAAAGWSFTGLFATSTSQSGGGGGGMNLAELFARPPLAGTLVAYPLLQTALEDLWIPVVFAAGWIGARWMRWGGAGQEVRALLFVMTLFLLVRWGLYEQYLLYPFALLLVDLYVYHPKRWGIFAFVAVAASAFLVTNSVLLVWFATPIDPAAFTWTQAIDSSPFWGTVRYDLLDLFSVAVTAALAQLAWVLYRDEAAPVPWPCRLWPFGGRRGGPPADRERAAAAEAPTPAEGA